MPTPVVVMAINEPPPRAFTCGMTAFVTRNTPVRLTFKHNCQRFNGVDSIGPSHSTPALAIRMSMPPNSETVCATAASTDSSLVTSHRTGTALPPADVMRSATVWIVPGTLPSCSERAATATAAPSRASAAAIVAPMPRLAPATKATLPSSAPVIARSFRGEAQRSVEANDFAVQIVVFDDALGQLRVLDRTAHALGERHLRTPVLLELVGRLAVRRRVDGARRDGHDADAERRQVARRDERHPEHAAFGGGVREL